MPGVLRHRSRSHGTLTGYVYPAGNPNDTSNPRTVGLGEDFCTDVVGNFEGVNYLEIQKAKRKPGTITGQESVWPVYGFSNYPYDNQPPFDYASSPHVAGWDAGIMDAVAAATKVAAWTSPGRATVSLPILLYELRELPEMLLRSKEKKRLSKDRRSGSVQNSGNSVAEINFAWDGLFRDLSQLLKFSADFEKRKREINAIYDRPHGLKRQRVVWSNSAQRIDYVAAHSWIAGLGVNRKFTTTSKQWVSVTWKPLFSFQMKPTDEEIANKAIQSIHGWKVSPANVWKALPWSWLADYFANVGDLLEVMDNSCEYLVDKCCVMTHIRTTVSDEIVVAHPDFTFRPASAIFEQKFRVPTTIGFRVNSPVFGGKQLVTLAGIAANHRSG